MTLWLVRAGMHGEREELALENDIAVIGWDELPDVTGIADRSELTSLIEETYPEASLNTRMNWESQVWPFIRVITEGDLVALPLKGRSAIALGRVTGPYRYRNDLAGVHHTRPVKWLTEKQRSASDQDLLFAHMICASVNTGPEPNELFDHLRENDVIDVAQHDRLARS